jgi:hypothetical protein
MNGGRNIATSGRAALAEFVRRRRAHSLGGATAILTANVQ